MDRIRLIALLALVAAATFSLERIGSARAQPDRPAVADQGATPVPVGGKIAADNACYVRLPDLPAALYAGFGAYNPKTGVLTYAGGAERRTQDNTIAQYDLYAIKLNSPLSHWATVPYGGNVGYTREQDKGCWGAASVQLSDTNWVSVLGKDGCDNGAFDTKTKKGGDMRELQIGDTANSSGVRWVPNSGAKGFVGELADQKGKLASMFGAYDSKRDRVIFGQGTFNSEQDDLTNDEVYSASPVGSQWQIQEIYPSGTIPVRRFGSCAAYVNDPDTGLDGVMVLGGQEAAIIGSPSTAYKEVWWLDFKSRSDGQWQNITGRFANMDALGPRSEGACAYDSATKTFYTWLGRASDKIPDGARRSTGAWRVSLANLADPAQPLQWERLAKDNTAGLAARRQIPSVWDSANKRMFVMGGRTDIDEFADVWAIYPDVTGEACQSLDPFAPFAVAVPTPAPTRTPGPGGGDLTPKACQFIDSRVPAAVISAALANPSSVQGYGELAYPNRPPGLNNPPRSYLSLHNPGVAWNPLFNGLIFKSGCP